MSAKQYKHTMAELIERHPYWSATTIQLAQLYRDADSAGEDADVDVDLALYGGRSYINNSYPSVRRLAQQLGLNLRIEREYKTGWFAHRMEIAVSGPLAKVMTLSSSLDKALAQSRGELAA